MKITCYLHMYPPLHMAGSETTVHAAMRAMAQRGHDVTVIADRTPEDYEHEGVKVVSLPARGQQQVVRDIARDADILITHLDCTSLAMSLALDVKKPLIHFIHNDAQLSYWHVDPRVRYKASLVIFNSRWVAARERFQSDPWSGDQIVIHPIIEPEKYKCERGNKTTLCNPTDGKGAHTIYALSEVMPDYEFLVVEGIYGEQIAPPNLGDEWVRKHPNVEHMKNDPDFRNVLRKTKVLLMPSNYESFGRCAVEAACAGIPSIVHPTEGLLESLRAERQPTAEELKGGWVSGAGIFCDRADTESWKAQIERLYSDDVYYRSRVDAAMKLANSLDPESEFDLLEESLLHTFDKWANNKEVESKMMWTSDRRIWRTQDGNFKAETDGRIPAGAVSLYVGIGGEVPEDVALRYGWVKPKDTPKQEAKAIEAPPENKAIQAPEATKGRKKRTA